MLFFRHSNTRRKILFRTALFAGAGMLLFFSAWVFTLSGNWLLTRAIPPLFSRISGVRMHAAEVKLMWNGSLQIRDFRLGSPEEPLLKVPEFSADLSLWHLLRHRALHLEEIRIADAAVLLLRNEDGTANWDGIRLQTPSDVSGRSGTASSGAPRLQLQKLLLDNASFIWRDRLNNRNHEVHWEKIHAAISNFGNRSRAEMEFEGNLHLASDRHISLNARTSLHGMFRLDEQLKLQELSFAAAVSQCSGNIGDQILKPGGVDLRCHLLHTENRWKLAEFLLRQTRQDTLQSTVDLSGEFALQPLHYQILLRKANLSGELLPFFCDFFFGVNPGDLSFAGEGTLAGDPDSLTAQGHWSLSRAEGMAFFGGKQFHLPAFDWNVSQNFALNWKKRHISLRKFQANLQSGGKIMAELDLKHPLSYQLDQKDPTPFTPNLQLRFADFRLGLLHFFLPAHQNMQLDGSLSGEIRAAEGSDPGSVQLTGNLQGRDLSFRCADWHFDRTEGEWSGTVELNGNRTLFHSPATTLQLRRNGQSLIRGTLSGNWDLSAKRAVLTAALDHANEDFLTVFPPSIAGFIRQLPLLPQHFQLSAKGEMIFRENHFRLQNCHASAIGENHAQFTVSLNQQDFHGGTPRDPWQFRLAAGAPADLLSPLLPHGIRLYSGNATLDAKAEAAPDFQTLTLESDLQLQQWSGAFWEHDFNEGELRLHAHLYMPSPDRVLINNSDLYFLHQGRPALRAGLSGSSHWTGENMQLTFDLRYLNEQFLNLLLPDRFRSGLLTGKIAASGDLRGTLHATGLLVLDKLSTRSATAPATGFLRFEATQNERESRLDPVEFHLLQNGDTLAKATLHARMPTAPDAPAQVNLTVDHADLSTLYDEVSIPEPDIPTEIPEEPVFRTPISFGTRPIHAALHLHNLHWGGTARFDFVGDFLLRENNMRTTDALLMVNQKPIRFSLDLNDLPGGMMLHTQGTVPEALDLGSLVSLWDSDQLSGNLTRCQWDFSWQDFLASKGDPAAQGFLKAELEDLNVRTGGDDPLVRLFLLPVEALVRVRGFLPSSLNLRDHWNSILQSVADPDSPLAELNFHRGDFHLALEDGKIRIHQADFRGSTIHTLSFSGGIDLSEPFALDLQTAIRTGMLQGNLPIQGTLTQPDAEIAKLLTSLTGLSIDKFPDFSPDSWQKIPARATSTFTRFLRDVIGIAPVQ